MPSEPQSAADGMLQGFSQPSYILVRPLFSWRRLYRVYSPCGALFALVEQPWFRLRTELVMYADEEESEPILLIKNRRIAAVNMEHDIFDAQSGERLGVVRTRGLRSLFRDAWDILDAQERLCGEMVEDGAWFWRRFFRFLPGRHRIDLGGREVARLTQTFGREVARLTQTFHFFRREFELEILQVEDPIEPRFAIACALIAMMADLRREDRQ